MSMTYTIEKTNSFSFVDARRIASRVAADLLRFQSLYGAPSDKTIDEYEAELAVLLNCDVLEWVEYGFQRNGKWTEAVARYTALPGGTLVPSDDPGKIRPNRDIAGASFTSFLHYNAGWWKKSESERAAIKAQLPFARSSGGEPPLESGIWVSDRNYTSGGRGLGRATARSIG